MPDTHTPSLTRPQLPSAAINAAIEAMLETSTRLIELLNQAAGDPDEEDCDAFGKHPDDEPDDEDCCAAADDDPGLLIGDGNPGDSADAEESGDTEPNGDEGDYSDNGCDHAMRYGINQTKPVGPDNPECS